MYTAESVKRDIWANIESANGNLITINREYLAFLLNKLEVSSFSRGFERGHSNTWEACYKESPKHKNFEGFKSNW